MTIQALAAIIISFCEVKDMDETQSTCVNFMLNCAVPVDLEINEKLVDACEQTYRENKVQIDAVWKEKQEGK